MDEIHCRRGKSLLRGAIILWRPASQAIDGAKKGLPRKKLIRSILL